MLQCKIRTLQGYNICTVQRLICQDAKLFGHCLLEYSYQYCYSPESSLLAVIVNCRSEHEMCCSVLDSDTPHVMISYHWGSQKMMIYVKDKLKAAGYKVWMDIDNMSKYYFISRYLALECFDFLIIILVYLICVLHFSHCMEK